MGMVDWSRQADQCLRRRIDRHADRPQVLQPPEYHTNPVFLRFQFLWSINILYQAKLFFITGLQNALEEYVYDVCGKLDEQYAQFVQPGFAPCQIEEHVREP
jgi:hypothetical protein